MLPYQFVHKQGDFLAFRFQQYQHAFGRISDPGPDVENFMQLDHRQVFSAYMYHLPLFPADHVDVACLGLEGFDDKAERDDVNLVTHGDGHSVQYCQRQRQADGNGATQSKTRDNLDAATDAFDVFLDHIHADAAPGNIGNDGGGGKTGGINQLPHFVIAHAVTDRHALFPGFGEYPLPIQPRSVIGHLDDDISALMCRLKGNGALRVFAHGNTRFRQFDAVIQAIAHHVVERIADFFNQPLVQLGALADDFKLHFLVEFARAIAHYTLKAAEHEIDRHHPHRHDGILQVAGVAFELRQPIDQALMQYLIHAGYGFSQHGLGNHQFADQIDHFVDFTYADTDGGVASGSDGRIVGGAA